MTVLSNPEADLAEVHDVAVVPGSAEAPDVREPGQAKRRALIASWLRGLPLPVFAVLAGLAALGVRAFHLYRAHDIFIDELSYTRIGQSLLHGARPELYHRPFFLHPPFFFDIESVWLRIFGDKQSVIDAIYELRWLEILCAGVTAALIVMITATVVSRAAALAAGALFVVDPLSVRVNTLVMLETPAVMLVLAGILIIVLALKKGSGVPIRRAVVAGLLIGFAMSTKELAGLIVLPALILAPFIGTGITRRAAACVGGTALGTYCAIVGLGGGFTKEWLDIKLQGAARLTGARQVSGFNQVGAPSLTSSVVSQLLHFGLSITVLLGGALAIALCVWKARGGGRFLAVTGLFSGIGLAYAVAFGTLEEQQSYFFIVPAIMALVAVAKVLPKKLTASRDIRRRQRGRNRSGGGELICRRAIAALGACAVAGGAVATTIALRTRDDSYMQLSDYVNTNVPAQTSVAATTETAEFVLPRVIAGNWGSPQEITTNRARLVVTSSKQDAKGYSKSSNDLPLWLSEHAHAVFTATGTSNGVLTLWKVDTYSRQPGARAPAPALPRQVRRAH